MKVGHVAVISLLLLVLAVGVINIAEASENRLEGMVTDQNGAPAAGVDVNIWDGKTLRQAVSNREGKFYVSGIAPGTFFAVRMTKSNSETVRMEGLKFPENENLSLTAKRVFLEPPDRSTESHWRAEIRAGGAGPRAIEANTNIKSHLS